MDNLRKLIRLASGKRLSSEAFVKLFIQLQDSSPISECAALDCLLSGDEDPLKALYIATLCARSESPIKLHSVIRRLFDSLLNDSKGSSSATVSDDVRTTLLIVLAQNAALYKVDAAIIELLSSILSQKSSLTLRDKSALEFFVQQLKQHGSVGEYASELSRLDISSSLSSDSVISVRQNTAASQPDASTAGFSPSRVLAYFWLNKTVTNLPIPRSFMSIALSFYAVGSVDAFIQSLIVTSIDCYAIALINKSVANQNLWRSFITKWLPAHLALFIKKHTANNLEEAIRVPFRKIDSATMQLFSGGDELDDMFDSFSNAASHKDIRIGFLQACATLGMISKDTMISILGEDEFESNLNVTMPETVFFQCPTLLAYFESYKMVDPADNSQLTIKSYFESIAQEDPDYTSFEKSKIASFGALFENCDGIAQSQLAELLMKLIRGWTQVQNTRCLRRICQSFSNRLYVLDQVFFNIDVRTFALTLKKVIDEWKIDDDEMNYQEVFTDYGCIETFLRLLCHRYKLGDFVHRVKGYNNAMSTDATFQSMTGEWITALFDTGGVGDELMKSTKLDDFKTLLPHILNQAIIATSSGIIDNDMLRGGMEYFLQPFLLGTLPEVIRELCSMLWRDPMNETLIQLIQIMALSPGISGEGQAIHEVAIAVVADDLHSCLTELAMVNMSDAHRKLNVSALDPYLTPSSPTVFPRNWVSLKSAVRDSIGVLLGWIQAISQNRSNGPPSFSSHVIEFAVELLGADEVLATMEQEVKQQSLQLGNDAQILDVIASIIVFFQSESKKPNSNLRKLVKDGPLLQKVETCEAWIAQCVPIKTGDS